MSANNSECLVFDTGPLSHFARENWLGALKAVVGPRIAVIPDVVVDELRNGAASDTRIQAALDADWIEHRELRQPAEIAQYAHYSSRLVRGTRNRGEAGVLALATAMSPQATVVIDDGAGRSLASTDGVSCKPTLALLCEAIRLDLLTVKLVSALADDLLKGSYRLPFDPGQFEQWAVDNGLV